MRKHDQDIMAGIMTAMDGKAWMPQAERAAETGRDGTKLPHNVRQAG
jgi:hypothetical protein